MSANGPHKLSVSMQINIRNELELGEGSAKLSCKNTTY